jgi:hypothetical protein
MKLFIWAEPYRVDYGTSAVFAVAETVEQARAIARGAPAYKYVEFGYGIRDYDLGEPTRVVDLPCAEWHEWSE